MGILNKRSIQISGRKTGVCLEDPFWEALKEIASERGTSLSGLASEIDNDRDSSNLSSAIRIFIFEHYRERSQHRR